MKRNIILIRNKILNKEKDFLSMNYIETWKIIVLFATMLDKI